MERDFVWSYECIRMNVLWVFNVYLAVFRTIVMAIPKSWDKSFEIALRDRISFSPDFSVARDSKKPLFSIDTPPPYVNHPIHIGQATTYCLMDFFARYKRMTGYDVVFPLGLDRNGLPIEVAAEKKFHIKFNQVSREEFIEKCRLVLEASSAESTDSFARLGISFNSYDDTNVVGGKYLTDSPEFRALTQATFIDLYHKGLIYEAKRIVNYCPGCRTTVADSEIDYVEKPTAFNDLAFKVKETGETIVIATTRPELVCTCAMVIFNPADARYAHLEGKTAFTPLFNREVPIRAHPSAKMDKGSGLVMMCSAGDLTDIWFFREMNLSPVIAIDPDGTMNAHAGFLQGLHVKKARAKMIESLVSAGLLLGSRQIQHRTPTCERSKDDIEFIEMPEFFCKQLEFKDDLRRMANEIHFFSDSSRQLLLDWIDGLAMDWPISRRRYYATEVPLWYCAQCRFVLVPPKGKYYQPWREAPPVHACPKCRSTHFEGETRVLDTWFDSSNTPLFVLEYGRDDAFFARHAPCSLRPQGKEIVRTWLYYSILKAFLLTRKTIFQDAWINYHILDEKGYKMSKSAGNVIDPQKILEEFGAEPFRLWAASEGNLEKTDFSCSRDRILGQQKTLNKLVNLCKFISLFHFEEGAKRVFSPEDEWILSELDRLLVLSRERFEHYDFFLPVSQLKFFVWEPFASHYVEMVKARAYNNDNRFSPESQAAAIWTLRFVLRNVLEMLAPVLPFATALLYDELFQENVHAKHFPRARENPSTKTVFSVAEVMEWNGRIWQAKRAANLALNAPLASFSIPKKFEPLAPALREMHRIEKIVFE